jgi:hypothetical protein
VGEDMQGRKKLGSERRERRRRNMGDVKRKEEIAENSIPFIRYHYTVSHIYTRDPFGPFKFQIEFQASPP